MSTFKNEKLKRNQNDSSKSFISLSFEMKKCYSYIVVLCLLENLFEDKEGVISANGVVFKVAEMEIGGQEDFQNTRASVRDNEGFNA